MEAEHKEKSSCRGRVREVEGKWERKRVEKGKDDFLGNGSGRAPGGEVGGEVGGAGGMGREGVEEGKLEG